MSDTTSLPSPTGKYNWLPTSSLFPSPRLFVGLSSKGSPDSEPAISPTSTLETKTFSSIGNPFFDRNTRKPLNESALTTTSVVTNITSESKHHPWDNCDSRAIGLGIVDALNNEKTDKKSPKTESRMVLFGSQLKIQIPPICLNSISPTCLVESPHTPINLGTKAKDPRVALHSPATPSPFGSTKLGSEVLTSPSHGLTSCLSPREMELSEDYTCIISHGPNPKTTHIYDNCILECCGDGFIASRKENRPSADCSSYPLADFLSNCYACKKKLGQGEDIFIYRGEKAFCSRECRYQEMLFDRGGLDDNCSPEPLNYSLAANEFMI